MKYDYDYGFGELENKLIRLFRSGAPDFSAAEELLRQGADINAFLPGSYDNLLSCILSCYPLSMYGDDYENT